MFYCWRGERGWQLPINLRTPNNKNCLIYSLWFCCNCSTLEHLVTRRNPSHEYVQINIKVNEQPIQRVFNSSLLWLSSGTAAYRVSRAQTTDVNVYTVYSCRVFASTNFETKLYISAPWWNNSLKYRKSPYLWNSWKLSWRLKRDHLPLLELLTCFVKFWTRRNHFMSCCSLKLAKLWTNDLAA